MFPRRREGEQKKVNEEMNEGNMPARDTHDKCIFSALHAIVIKRESKTGLADRHLQVPCVHSQISLALWKFCKVICMFP